jgi:RNA polymerase sigma factor (sigma-70 family)
MPTRERTNQTTTELVEAARRRDPQAWDELMFRYGGMVRGVTGRYRMQEADAADAVQSTWLRAVEQLHTLRDPERLGSWLATTAGRECLALLRRSRRELPDEDVADAQVAEVPGPESAAIDAEAGRAVRTAVDELTDRRRQLVDELFYKSGQDYTDVSRAIDIPVGSIGPTRGRILRVLRRSLERAGFGTGSPVPTSGRQLTV